MVSRQALARLPQPARRGPDAGGAHRATRGREAGGAGRAGAAAEDRRGAARRARRAGRADRREGRDPPAGRGAAGRGAAQGRRPGRADDHPAHDLQRQPRHRQDHRRPAGGRHLPRARPALEGPAGRGRPLRAGGRLPRPDRDEDRRRGEVRRGRRAVHRRGLLAVRRPVRHRGDRHPGQGDGGQARRPGRDRGRLPGADGRLHRPEPRPREPVPHPDRLRRLHRRRAGRRSSR